MNNTILKVENLSKQYRLGLVGTGTISHDLNRWWHRIRGKEDPYLKIGEVNNRSSKGESKYVWALKDINFEVKQGEVLGIIGKNGAGKSTLLKILSKVTGPTTGNIKVKGRIASLLEVGTGFHPELTGQENIFLNGALLGMTRSEIKKKLDEIVDFAGVERYIDTPVKRYSSGMYVRLAFAVAAHLEPEILIVDEVLAVGDAEFQKKAIGKMKDVSKGDGRTVLFVSHNMTSLEKLCSRAVVLKNGFIDFSGTAIESIQYYLNTSLRKIEQISLKDRTDRKGSGEVRFIGYLIRDAKTKNRILKVKSGQDIEIIFQVKTRRMDIDRIQFDIGINSDTQNRIAWLSTSLHDQSMNEILDNQIVVRINKFPFNQGKYSLTLFLKSKGIILDWVQNAIFFEVEGGDFFNSGRAVLNQGCYLVNHSFL